jgi:hypothetical protein
LAKSKIHKAVFATNSNDITRTIFGLPLTGKKSNTDKNYYVYPQPDPKDLTRVLVTGINSTVTDPKDPKNLALYFIKNQQKGVVS